MRQPKSAHQKTQTPIVAKQILYLMRAEHITKIGGIAFLSMQVYFGKMCKRVYYPYEKSTHQAYGICLACLLYQDLRQIQPKISKNIF